MENTLFLQSEVADPYALYERMREQNPVYRDTVNGIWAVYSHAHCKRILEAGAANIAALLSRLLDAKAKEVDWVSAVCKRLPALAVMDGFGFAAEDVDFVLRNIERLTKLMLPNKSEQQITDVNAVRACQGINCTFWLAKAHNLFLDRP